ncbi:MAG: MBL fold metallo-hydrolase [Candidatus Aminicenantaceae bacterium]
MLSRLSYLAYSFFIFLLLILISIHVQAQKKEDINGLLEKKLEEKEAIIWHLGHSSWAIKTKSHFLIFDYVGTGRKPAEPSLANGYINTLEIKDQNVFVFITHEHADHYSRAIFDWEKSVRDITYIFGWQAVTEQKYVCIGQRERKKIDDMEILTITSTDAGVGFLIKMDGLVIFHGGDHAHWGGSMESFLKEIVYLAQSKKELDIAFLAITTGMGQRRESITRGVFYAIENIQPKVIFPMHAGGKEHLYKKFALEAKKKEFKTKVHYAERKGDRFFYKNGKIR